MDEIAQVCVLKVNNDNNNKRPRKWTASIWIASGFSSEMVIPKRLAEKYRLDEACTVVLEEKDEGILMRRLDL